MKLRIKAILSSFIILLVIACNSNNESPVSSTPESTTDVSLCIAPSIEQSELPMDNPAKSRQTVKGLYAINIFWKGKSLTSYQPYASGLFDDISQIAIKLINGYEYRFDCTFLDESELPYRIIKNNEYEYGKPFALSNGTIYAPVTNKLIVSISPFNNNSQFYTGIYSGETETTEGITLSRPTLHRYYGSTTVNLTNSDGTSPVAVNIDLLRAYYSLQFTATKLSEGAKLRVTLLEDDIYILTGADNNEVKSAERLFSFTKVADSGNGRITEIEQQTIKVEYCAANSTEWQPVYTEDPTINLKRNKRNIFHFVDIDQFTGQGNINITDGEVGGAPTDTNEENISANNNK